MPSVQPNLQLTCNNLTTNLIDRQVAIDALEKVADLYYYNEAWNYAIGRAEIEIEKLPSVQQELPWIPCSERLPEEDHWLGGSGKQFSEQVLVTIVNYDDDDSWVYISHTIDGEWMLELPMHCEITAWMPLPESYKGDK